jgi:hypothetical protein
MEAVPCSETVEPVCTTWHENVKKKKKNDSDLVNAFVLVLFLLLTYSMEQSPS